MIESDQQMVNQYFKYIQDSGYRYWKDNLGFYFERGKKRFSVIQVGPLMDVYYNIKQNGKYTLKEKLTGQVLLFNCLRWIYDKSRETIVEETQNTVQQTTPQWTEFNSAANFKS